LKDVRTDSNAIFVISSKAYGYKLIKNDLTGLAKHARSFR